MSDGYAIVDGRFWRIVGFNWTPDERAVLTAWWDAEYRDMLAASNDPIKAALILRRMRWLLGE